MKRKAVIVLNFDVEDFIEARAREGEIKQFVERLRVAFDDVDLRVTDRRPRTAKRAVTPPLYRPTSASSV